MDFFLLFGDQYKSNFLLSIILHLIERIISVGEYRIRQRGAHLPIVHASCPPRNDDLGAEVNFDKIDLRTHFHLIYDLLLLFKDSF